MADLEAPSFSLGLDFDLDSEPKRTLREADSTPPQFSVTTTTLQEDEDDFEFLMMGHEPQVSELPRAFKRLRHGLTAKPTPALNNVDDDDIENFSSQEDLCRDEPASSQYYTMCSSSKFPLRGHGILTTEPANQGKETTRKQVSDANREASSNKTMFPKLTISPLRRFQLIDSDSDDPSVSEGAKRVTNKVDSSLKGKQSNTGQHVASEDRSRMKQPVSISQTQDLWKDFCSEKSFHIPTPALDEVCEEYFRSVKQKKEAQNSNKGCYQNCVVSENNKQWGDVANPRPPARCYFFHDDPRIKQLVRSRLPNFFFLDAVNNGGYNQISASVIDYMGQFSHQEVSKQAAAKKNPGVGSRRSRKNSKKSNVEEVTEGSGSWVNPNSCAGIPKDAGKIRVHAVHQSVGHWYIAQDGKKVYVNKNGKELTGQAAYRQYRKESGAGFKRSKMKSASKKKMKH